LFLETNQEVQPSSQWHACTGRTWFLSRS
jgi:hypothetical protein